jgi:hypothetical protein
MQIEMIKIQKLNSKQVQYPKFKGIKFYVLSLFSAWGLEFRILLIVWNLELGIFYYLEYSKILTCDISAVPILDFWLDP